MLLDEFSVIFDRPEKVKKLREYILSLAVRGKLVPQDENDEPASLLLERIGEEKNRLIKEKKTKKEKPLPEISEDEIPYELPKSWEWVRLGKILNVKSSKRVYEKDYVKDGIPFFRSKEIGELSKGYNNPNAQHFITREKYNEIKEIYGVPSKGDILLTSVGSIGNTWIVDDREFYYKDGNITQLEKCDYINNFYIQFFIKSQLFYEQVCNSVSGTAYNALTIIKLKGLILPIPPLNEQKRIVKKLDCLMEFCDKLEEQLERKVKYGYLSAKSVLNDVSNCSTYEELEETLKFIIDNFKDLTLTDGAVGELKNNILSLAVRGKLVPQDENDEPASLLLDRIKQEKDRLVKEKIIKKEKPLSEISEDEIPYELPKGWEWVRFKDIANIISGKSFNSSDFYNEGEGIKSIKITNVGVGEFIETKGSLLPNKFKEKNEDYIVNENDILIALTRPYIKDGLKVCRCSNKYHKSLLNQRVAMVKKIINNNDLIDYIYIYLKSSNSLSYIKSKCTATGQPNLSINSLYNLPISLPPINEQKLIVKKVDKLMEICDELELIIEKSKKYNEQLMESILKDSLKV